MFLDRACRRSFLFAPDDCLNGKRARNGREMRATLTYHARSTPLSHVPLSRPTLFSSYNPRSVSLPDFREKTEKTASSLRWPACFTLWVISLSIQRSFRRLDEINFKRENVHGQTENIQSVRKWLEGEHSLYIFCCFHVTLRETRSFTVCISVKHTKTKLRCINIKRPNNK